MTAARMIGLGIAIVVTMGIGAASLLQAQQTTPKSAPPPAARTELRERVLALRTELDLVQLKFDVLRASLVEVLSAVEKAKLSSLSPMTIQGDSALEFFGIDKKRAEKCGEDMRKALETMQREFANQARTLNEKKLDLADAEKQYEREAR